MLGTNVAEAAGGNLEEGAEAEFGSLLSRFGDLRAQVASMPNDQRLAVAEQVVMDFWKAIGGPDEELFGLQEELGIISGADAESHNHN
jgi:hypothetical protein